MRAVAGFAHAATSAFERAKANHITPSHEPGSTGEPGRYGFGRSKRVGSCTSRRTRRPSLIAGAKRARASAARTEWGERATDRKAFAINIQAS